MNRTAYIFLLLLTAVASCVSESQDYAKPMTPESSSDSEPEAKPMHGYIDLQLGTSATRATTTTISQEEAKNFLVSVYRGGELVSEETRVEGLVHMTFPAGSGYSLDVQSCTEQEAIDANEGWGQKRFTGSSRTFAIVANQSTKVSVGCTVANSAVSVTLPDGSEYSVTLSDGGTRTLTTTTDRMAWFNIPPSGDKPTVTITVMKGEEQVGQTSVTLDKPAAIKDVNITTDGASTIGLEITYDDEFSVVDTEISL